MGLIEIKTGTTSTDAECGKSSSVGLIVGVAAVGVLLLAVLIVLILCWKLKRKKQRYNQCKN